jgi:hypothetical protein
MADEYKFPDCPGSVGNGLEMYTNYGVEPGGFLRAVLENDLFGAVCRADDGNLRLLRDIVQYVNLNLPGGITGTPKAVEYWINHKAKERSQE